MAHGECSLEGKKLKCHYTEQSSTNIKQKGQAKSEEERTYLGSGYAFASYDKGGFSFSSEQFSLVISQQFAFPILSTIRRAFLIGNEMWPTLCLPTSPVPTTTIGLFCLFFSYFFLLCARRVFHSFHSLILRDDRPILVMTDRF
jgi:hypothetical protein